MTYLIDQVGPDFQKPPVKMVGEDGNAFAIIGRVTKALKKAGRADLADEYRTRAMQGNYNQLVALVFDYCSVDEEDEE